MESQKKYSGLICLPILPSIYKQLPQRGKVKEKTPKVYEEGLLEHPTIPGLMLNLEQRLLWGELEIVNCDGDFLWRQETWREKNSRIKWEKPFQMTPSTTSESVPPKPKHYYPSDIEARDKKVSEEKALRLKEAAAANEAKEKEAAAARRAEADAANEAKENEAAIAAHKAKEAEKEKEAAAAEAVAGLAKLRAFHTSALAARILLKKTKQENSEKSHLLNLEWRLASLLSRLQSLIDDVEAGKPLGELQVLAGETLEDEIEAMGYEIALLEKVIQVLKGKDRGL